MSLRSAFLWALIGSLAVGAALAIAALLIPAWSGRIEEIIATALVIAAFSLLALGCSIVIGRRVLVPVMWLGIVASAGAAGAWVYLIWYGQWADMRLIERSAVQLTTIAVWAAIIGGLLARPVTHRAVRHTRWSAVAFFTAGAALTSAVAWFEFRDWWILRLYVTLVIVLIAHLWPAALLRVRLDRSTGRTVRLATLAVAFVLAVYIILGVWEIVEIDTYWPARITGVLSILTACGTIVTGILALIEWLARRSEERSVPVKVDVQMTCPRCNTAQQIPTGGAKCRRCGLRIDVVVEESRCACGYLLYNLTGDVCPECGRTIPKVIPAAS